MRNDICGSNTPPEIKDLWQTPGYVFRALDKEFKFVADVAANRNNTMCNVFIPEEQDTLITPWNTVAKPGEYVWMNPPFSNPRPFLEKAAREQQEEMIGCVMLLPADPSVGWFEFGCNTANECRLIIGGRLAFINAKTGKPGRINNKGSLFFIWHPGCHLDCFFTKVTRQQLMLRGLEE
ncbi:phage N-6-adenine-methyltransferase [Escherichia coli]|nr:phage N-6-adenine-methyltransferase [Escherichia coli]